MARLFDLTSAVGSDLRLISDPEFAAILYQTILIVLNKAWLLDELNRMIVIHNTEQKVAAAVPDDPSIWLPRERAVIAKGMIMLRLTNGDGRAFVIAVLVEVTGGEMILWAEIELIESNLVREQLRRGPVKFQGELAPQLCWHGRDCVGHMVFVELTRKCLEDQHLSAVKVGQNNLEAFTVQEAVLGKSEAELLAREWIHQLLLADAKMAEFSHGEEIKDLDKVPRNQFLVAYSEVLESLQIIVDFATLLLQIHFL